MNCRQIQREMSAYLDGELPEAQRAGIAAHLQTCATCRQKAEELYQLGRGIAAQAKAPVPSQFLANIHRQIRTEQVAEGRGTWFDALFRPVWLKLPVEVLAVVAIVVGVSILVRPAPCTVAESQFKHRQSAPQEEAKKKTELAKEADRLVSATAPPEPPAASEMRDAASVSVATSDLSESALPVPGPAVPSPPATTPAAPVVALGAGDVKDTLTEVPADRFGNDQLKSKMARSARATTLTFATSLVQSQVVAVVTAVNGRVILSDARCVRAEIPASSVANVQSQLVAVAGLKMQVAAAELERADRPMANGYLGVAKGGAAASGLGSEFGGRAVPAEKNVVIEIQLVPAEKQNP